MAEGEVVAAHHVMGRQSIDDHVMNEGFRRHPREGAVEAQHDQMIDAQGRDLARLGTQRGQAERRHVRLEDVARVRLEGHDRPRPAGRVGDAAGFADDRLMAAVHAIEIADGDNGAPGLGGQAVEMTKDAHGR